MYLLIHIITSILVLSAAQSQSSSTPSSSSFYSSSRSYSFPSSFSYMLGYRPYQRAECRNPFPTKSDINPYDVIISGRVDDVRPTEVGGGSINSDLSSGESRYMVSVYVRRVIFGPQSLRRQRVTITGFGDSNKSWCHSNARKDESWIFVLAPIAPDFFRLNSSLIRVTLSNLEKIDSIVAGESFTRHRSVIELPCEQKYCENNANCIPDENSPDGARCECLTFCKPTYAPVCGSNGETYNNECELRMRSCLMKKNLFVKSTIPCTQSSRTVAGQQHSGVSSYYYRSSSERHHSNPTTPSVHYNQHHHRHRPDSDRRSHHRSSVTSTTNTQRTRQY